MKKKYIDAYIEMAIRFGKTSEAKRLKVGALIVKNNQIISQGVNGQPPGWETEICEDLEGRTLPTVRHAEVAALEKLWHSNETSKGAQMFISHSPCFQCALKIKTAGITEVYYKEEYRCRDGIDYLVNHGVKVTHYQKQEDYGKVLENNLEN